MIGGKRGLCSTTRRERAARTPRDGPLDAGADVLAWSLLVEEVVVH